MSKYEFTNNELHNLNKIEEDLIISLFGTNDRRYIITKYIKQAYLMGREMNTDINFSKL